MNSTSRFSTNNAQEQPKQTVLDWSNFINVPGTRLLPGVVQLSENEFVVDQALYHEILFWHKQFLEHCYFLFLQLQNQAHFYDPDVLFSPLSENYPQVTAAEEALTDANSGLINPGADVQHNDMDTNVIREWKRTALELTVRWKDYENELVRQVQRYGTTELGDEIPVDYLQLTELLNLTKQFKQTLLRAENDGIWIGFAYPAFLVHILSELMFFEHRLAGEISPQQELLFYLQISADHIELNAHLLDLDGSFEKRERVRRTDALAEQGYQLLSNLDRRALLDENEFQQVLEEAYNYIQLANAWGLTARILVDRHQLPGIAHPMMLLHDIREGNHAAERLEEIYAEIEQDDEPLTSDVAVPDPLDDSTWSPALYPSREQFELARAQNQQLVGEVLIDDFGEVVGAQAMIEEDQGLDGDAQEAAEAEAELLSAAHSYAQQQAQAASDHYTALHDNLEQNNFEQNGSDSDYDAEGDSAGSELSQSRNSNSNNSNNSNSELSELSQLSELSETGSQNQDKLLDLSQ
jgi:hypothetical protein